MRISEINDLSDLKHAIDSIEQRKEYELKSVKKDYASLKTQLAPSGLLSSLCDSIGDKTSDVLLSLFSRFLEK